MIFALRKSFQITKSFASSMATMLKDIFVWGASYLSAFKHSYSIVFTYRDPDKAQQEINSLLRRLSNQRDKVEILVIGVSEKEHGSTGIIGATGIKKLSNQSTVAEARNRAILKCRNEWIIFIDERHVVTRQYLWKIDRALRANDKVKSVITNINQINLDSEDNIISNNIDPLRQIQTQRLINFSKEDGLVCVDATGVAFNRREVIRQQLEFSQTIDEVTSAGLFTNRYHEQLLDRDKSLFVTAIINHKLDLSLRQQLSGRWLTVDNLVGCLGEFKSILTSESSNNRVSPQSRVFIIHQLSQIILANLDRRLQGSDGEIEKLFKVYRSIVELVSAEAIISYKPPGLWFYLRQGLLGVIGKSMPVQLMFVDNYDLTNNELRLITHLANRARKPEEVLLNGNPIRPSHVKIRQRDVFNRPFVLESIMWIPVGGVTKIQVSGKENETLFSLSGRQASEVDLAEIKKVYDMRYLAESDGVVGRNIIRILRSNLVGSRYKKTIILSDRREKADDNAEHFYGYLKENSDLDIYFTIDKNCPDWTRLKGQGFKLVGYGSFKHYLLLVNTKLIISSQSLSSMFREIGKFNELKNFRGHFVFLQHGVILHDLGRWLSSEKIDLFVTSAKDEYESIVADNTDYAFTDKEVKLTGLARHDELKRKSEHISGAKLNQIAVLPTWRKVLYDIDGNPISLKNEQAFKESRFYIEWNKLLSSPELDQVLNKHKLKLKLAMHPNFSDYTKLFHKDDIIKHFDADTYSVQDLFAESRYLITDYSSVAFEMGYLRRPVLYYQFDRSFLYGSGASYQEGYFDYDSNGFGPVTFDASTLIKKLDRLLSTPKSNTQYMTRMDGFFRYSDSRNSERIYKSIKSTRLA